MIFDRIKPESKVKTTYITQRPSYPRTKFYSVFDLFLLCKKHWIRPFEKFYNIDESVYTCPKCENEDV